MEINKQKFSKTKKEAEDFYKSIGKVYCPYFKEDVAFNAKGLEHLKFKGKNKVRVIADQYKRFKLLRLAPKIIKVSHTLQEFFTEKRFEKQNINSRWENRLVQVIYYGFVAIFDNTRVKIIIKEIEGGNKFFLEHNSILEDKKRFTWA